jgi:hypothetical protein
MKVGTKSLLFGVHCWFLHPWAVAMAWIKLFGWPTDWRIWLCFLVHDWGYWGCAEMDGLEGDQHPIRGAKILSKTIRALGGSWDEADKWYEFCLYHSRFFAKQHGAPVSKLCYADKLSVAYTPAWIYIPVAALTGELWEYMTVSKSPSYNPYVWHRRFQDYITEWVRVHKDGDGHDQWSESRSICQKGQGVDSDTPAVIQ